MSTKIPWADETWNPMTGCTPVSEACEHCYAERMAGRHLPATRCPRCHGKGYAGWDFADPCPACNTGEDADVHPGNVGFTPTFHPDRLDKPLHWRKPRRIFVCSMSDLFHEAFTDEQRAEVFGRIAHNTRHDFMVLTKRPGAMRDFMLSASSRVNDVVNAIDDLVNVADDYRHPRAWPPTNLWLGVTVENQARADERIPILLDTPAAVRFVSVEPMLGPVDFRKVPGFNLAGQAGVDLLRNFWVIVGGETGPGARPMQSEWALDVYRQCKAAGVPFFWKQAGAAAREGQPHEWIPTQEIHDMVATREFPR